MYSRTVPSCCRISLGIVLLRFLSCTLRPKSPNLMELLERKMLAHVEREGGGRREEGKGERRREGGREGGGKGGGREERCEVGR